MSIVLVWLIIISVIVMGLLLKERFSRDKIDMIKKIFSTTTFNKGGFSTIQKQKEEPKNTYVSIEEYNKLLSRVNILEGEIQNISSYSKRLSDESKNIEVCIKQLSRTTDYQINQLVKELNSLRANIVSDSTEAQECENFPKIVYATQVDSEIPKGFLPDSLTMSAGAHLYKIMIESQSEASFVLTDNIAVQQELLLTLQSGILNDTCDFEGTPVESSSQINTIENGKLIKENGVWKICKKIKVNFL